MCECELCGRIISVRGENLVSGNTKGCGCDRNQKISRGLHENKLNKYEFNNELNCWMGFANNTQSVFLFDKDDYDLVSNYCWYENNDGRIITRLSRSEQIFLHRLLMFGLNARQHCELVDHINRNPMDNRRCNLRTCSNAENLRNSTKSHSASGIRGVTFNKQSGMWMAYIEVNGKHINLGKFTDINDAAKVRREKELEYFGEFAPR